MNSCCKHCKHCRLDRILKSFENRGYTYKWENRKQYRIRWWFFGKKRYQQKQVKIGFICETMIPAILYKWKTIEIK